MADFHRETTAEETNRQPNFYLHGEEEIILRKLFTKTVCKRCHFLLANSRSVSDSAKAPLEIITGLPEVFSAPDWAPLNKGPLWIYKAKKMNAVCWEADGLFVFIRLDTLDLLAADR